MKKKPTDKQKRERAARVKTLRRLLGYKSQTDFSKALGISTPTLKMYEAPLGNGLSAKSAKLMVEFTRQTSLVCHYDWLFDGKGDIPYFINDTEVWFKEEKENTLKSEIDFFINQHSQALIAPIKDTACLPQVPSGAYVGGICCALTDIQTYEQKLCIVRTQTNHIAVRQVHRTSSPEHFHLAVTNTQDNHIEPLLLDVEVIALAPVSRIWLP